MSCNFSKGKEEYLKVISKYVEIHATVYTESGGDSGLPSFVKNHGILSGADLQRLLLESKVSLSIYLSFHEMS